MGLKRTNVHGSSPLSRGIQIRLSEPLVKARIIPALAGNTVSGSGRGIWCQDHPRSRGEYLASSTVGHGQGGSSPLSRGIRLWFGVVLPVVGIIPALAGNTHAWTHTPRIMWDHPRSRGEYGVVLLPLDPLPGSSPLSRGILVPAGVWCVSMGIIPALAGNTFRWHTGDWEGPDHPRSRGEYPSDAGGGGFQYGSSPLSRGILDCPANVYYRYRIIPALAGNTQPGIIRGAINRDHPRSRGEYQYGPLLVSPRPGSSPLSRGIPLFLLYAQQGHKDHPRSRGEYRGSINRAPPYPGSSPLSRGILFRELIR